MPPQSTAAAVNAPSPKASTLRVIYASIAELLIWFLRDRSSPAARAVSAIALADNTWRRASILLRRGKAIEANRARYFLTHRLRRADFFSAHDQCVSALRRRIMGDRPSVPRPWSRSRANSNDGLSESAPPDRSVVELNC